MGTLPVSHGHQYIVVAIEHISNRIETMPTKTNNSKMVQKFLRENILWRFSIPKALINDGGSPFL